MSQVIETAVANRAHSDERVFARLDVKVSWNDTSLGQVRTISGVTENLGSNSALVVVDVLPPVGEVITLALSDNGKEFISLPARVMRVERNPAKPKAALIIEKQLDDWRDIALVKAQSWVTRDLKVNYEGDDWLN